MLSSSPGAEKDQKSSLCRKSSLFLFNLIGRKKQRLSLCLREQPAASGSSHNILCFHGRDTEAFLFLSRHAPSECLLCFVSPTQTSESEVHFDVETAIKVLRQAGCYSHAVYLAEKHAHHEWYLKIQLEDIKVRPNSLPDAELHFQLLKLTSWSASGCWRNLRGALTLEGCV